MFVWNENLIVVASCRVATDPELGGGGRELAAKVGQMRRPGGLYTQASAPLSSHFSDTH